MAFTLLKSYFYQHVFFFTEAYSLVGQYATNVAGFVALTFLG